MGLRANDVYDVLGLPSGLRLHHVLTVSVIQAVAAEASPRLSAICEEASVAMALHDVGNAVKSVSDPRDQILMLQEPEESLDRWRLYIDMQQARYGTDDHQATKIMFAELGVSAWVTDLVMRKSSSNLQKIVKAGDPLEMLVLYSDMRVAPSGLVSVRQRLDEAVARYRGTNRSGLGGTVTLQELEQLERQVSEAFGINVAAIDDKRIEGFYEAALFLDMKRAFSD